MHNAFTMYLSKKDHFYITKKALNQSATKINLKADKSKVKYMRI